MPFYSPKWDKTVARISNRMKTNFSGTQADSRLSNHDNRLSKDSLSKNLKFYPLEDNGNPDNRLSTSDNRLLVLSEDSGFWLQRLIIDYCKADNRLLRASELGSSKLQWLIVDCH